MLFAIIDNRLSSASLHTSTLDDMLGHEAAAMMRLAHFFLSAFSRRFTKLLILFLDFSIFTILLALSHAKMMPIKTCHDFRGMMLHYIFMLTFLQSYYIIDYSAAPTFSQGKVYAYIHLFNYFCSADGTACYFLDTLLSSSLTSFFSHSARHARTSHIYHARQVHFARHFSYITD